MSIHKTGFGRGVLAGALLLAFSCFPAVAQTPAAQSGAEQKARVLARVTDTVDDTNRTVLHGNVHPKARAEFDRGAVADAQPVTRILLVKQDARYGLGVGHRAAIKLRACLRMHVAVQHRAVGIVHRVRDARQHASLLLRSGLRRGCLRDGRKARKRQQQSTSQYTSTETSFVDAHNPPDCKYFSYYHATGNNGNPKLQKQAGEIDFNPKGAGCS